MGRPKPNNGTSGGVAPNKRRRVKSNK
jgi:hypothetical protein